MNAAGLPPVPRVSYNDAHANRAPRGHHAVRQVVLDTETTGLEPEQGHRIIEVGCVEIVNRRPTGRTFHRYINPEREIDPGAVDVHGLTPEFLADKPRFCEVVAEFLSFVEGAELVIHNAPFDVGFINSELGRDGRGCGLIEDLCGVLDTLELARRQHPGQRNSLDALCRRYGVDNSRRELHGALLDAQLLAEVYLAMTGGQVKLSLGRRRSRADSKDGGIRRVDRAGLALPVIAASAVEEAAHEAYLAHLDGAAGGRCLWRELEEGITGSEPAVAVSAR
jgi:DNA polymerase-3 subunit epsilon